MDWKSIIETLSKVHSQREIAVVSKLDPATITRLKQGALTRVSYEAGCRLVDMHRKAERKAKRSAA